MCELSPPPTSRASESWWAVGAAVLSGSAEPRRFTADQDPSQDPAAALLSHHSLLAVVAGEGPSSQPCVLNLMSFNMRHSEPGRDWQREQSSVPAPRSYKSIGDTCWDR